MRKKQPNTVLAKVLFPMFVIAVVAGSFAVDWRYLGRSPVSYYGMGAIPMFAACKIKDGDTKVVAHKKPTVSKDDKKSAAAKVKKSDKKTKA